MEASAAGVEAWSPRLKELEISRGSVPEGARKQITCELMDEVSSAGMPIVELAAAEGPPATVLSMAGDKSSKLALNDKPLSEADSNDMEAVDEADA